MLIKTDICVIGAGPAGLTVAVGAVELGASVILIEGGKMGGNCLNTGCIPSKALLAAAHAAHTTKTASTFGINASHEMINMSVVHDYIKQIIDDIAPADSAERLEHLGIRVIKGMAEFHDADHLLVGEQVIKAKRFIIATGSIPFIPKITGLDTVRYFTTDTIFNLRAPIEDLIVLGGGPVGVEMAQAHARLGSKVTLITDRAIMPKDDPEVVEILRQNLIAENITLVENTTINLVEKKKDDIVVSFTKGNKRASVIGTHLLVAVGRRANVNSLKLEKADVAFDEDFGIKVDKYMRTSNKNIYAAGDVLGQYLFTHAASYQAHIILKNALMRCSTSVDYRALSWVTFTDPELAKVGLSEAEAAHQHIKYTVLRMPFSHNDRARTEHATNGLVKVIINQRGRVLGATIVGKHAGELIMFWTMAIAQKLKMKDLAHLIVPYPTYNNINRSLALKYYHRQLHCKWTKKIVRFFLRVYG